MGRRILCVEDEAVVAMLIEDVLLDAGFTVVGPFAKQAPAIAAITEGSVDAAVLDVNIRGERSYPIADALVENDIPFLFLTGYGEQGVDQRYRDHRIVQKPFSRGDFLTTLGRILEP